MSSKTNDTRDNLKQSSGHPSLENPEISTSKVLTSNPRQNDIPNQCLIIIND